MKNIRLLFFLFFCLWIITPVFAQEMDSSGELPIVLEADRLEHDRDLGIITARGNVKVQSQNRILTSEQLSYNQNTGVMTASGNVNLIEANGEILQSNFVELDQNMATGLVDELFIQLNSHTRLAARRAIRDNEHISQLETAVYSPCLPCADDAEKPLFWQIKADKVIRDTKAERISYRHARLELAGVPVLYTPYFAHPDINIDRQSGLLTPSWGSSEFLGTFYRQPVYWAISPYQDATFSPIYSENQSMIYEGEYRQNIENGGFIVKASITDGKDEPDHGDYFGHIYSRGDKSFDEEWRMRWAMGASSDRDYFDDYDLFEDMPTSYFANEIALEGFNDRQYVSAQASWYQELRDGNETDHANLAPYLRYSGLGAGDRFGGRWGLDASMLTITKGEKIEQGQRLILDGSYQLSTLLDQGLLLDHKLSLRVDGYYSQFTDEEIKRADLSDSASHFRTVPRYQVKASYPLSRATKNGNQMITPMASLVLAPTDVGNDKEIANSDSLIFENDDSNLFANNLSPGNDLIESGVRAIFGTDFRHDFYDGKAVSLFVGQSYLFHEDDRIADELNIHEGRSDVVGRIDVQAQDYGSYYYKFNYDKDLNHLQKSDFNASFGDPALRFSGGYKFIDVNLIDNATHDYERIYGSLSSQITKEWSFSASGSRDLAQEQSIGTAMNLHYEDECFIFTSMASHDYNYGSEDETKILFQVTFKTIGGITF